MTMGGCKKEAMTNVRERRLTEAKRTMIKFSALAVNPALQILQVLKSLVRVRARRAKSQGERIVRIRPPQVFVHWLVCYASTRQLLHICVGKGAQGSGGLCPLGRQSLGWLKLITGLRPWLRCGSSLPWLSGVWQDLLSHATVKPWRVCGPSGCGAANELLGQRQRPWWDGRAGLKKKTGSVAGQRRLGRRPPRGWRIVRHFNIDSTI